MSPFFIPFSSQEVDGPVAVVFYIFESVARHIAGIVRPDEGELLGLDIRPRINNIETEVEIIGHIYFEILLHILIAVKVIAGTEALDYIIHFFFSFRGVSQFYSLITVRNLVLPSTAAWPCGRFGSK